jgi:hypothetical protein
MSCPDLTWTPILYTGVTAPIIGTTSLDKLKELIGKYQVPAGGASYSVLGAKLTAVGVFS